MSNAPANTRTTIMAAMFAALGSLTKISRSGRSIIFIIPTCGRHDLSGDDAEAMRQVMAAGLNIDAVTPEQIDAYTSWHERMYEDMRIGDEARFRIGREFSALYGACTLEPANRVELLDGWGNAVECRVFKCLSGFEGGKFITRPDYEKIERFIDSARREHPEFSNTRVVDNNLLKHYAS